MSPGKTIKIAFVTDLHVTEVSAGKDDSESFLSVATPDQPKVNPFVDLKSLIAQEGLTADIVICGGDLADKSSQSGQIYGWTRVNQLGVDLGAKRVWGTAGNHDVDSRGSITNYDAKGALQALEPPFPGYDDPALVDKYWSRNFVIEEFAGCRFLNINSCAFHGYGSHGDPEHTRGRVSEITLNKIREELSAKKHDGPNVAFFHHHPLMSNLPGEQDNSEMIGGVKLIEILADTAKVGKWTILHGHKHFPQIQYGPHGARCPVIFSGGSFSSKRLSSTASTNNFYLFELLLDPTPVNLTLAGQVKSWQWQLSKGWIPSQNDQMPKEIGFGFMEEPLQVAKQVAIFINSSPEPFLTWDEITQNDPRIQYMMPRDLADMCDYLEQNHSIRANKSTKGDYTQFVKVK